MIERAKTVIFAGITPVHKNFNSPELPLHVPVVPAFNLELRRTKELSDEVKKRVSKFNLFKITGLDRTVLDSENGMPARIVGGSTLYSLHDELYEAVKKSKGIVEQDKVGDDYIPYAADTSSQSLAEGQIVMVHEVYIAQQRGNNPNWRLVNANAGKHVQYLLNDPDQATYRFDVNRINA